jgi:formylglycine-generating enzyme required for sulfatase activity
VQWTMGGDRVQAEAPACQVVLTNDFWISVFPITVGQHKAVGASNRTTS